MTWLYRKREVKEIPDIYIGFVYLITNNLSGRKYIGKKLAKFKKTTYKTVTLNNGTKKKKKIRSLVDSDWRDYWSSSDELKKDVQALGQANFTREILKYCITRTELSYYEAKYQFQHDVLLNEGLWYNGWIFVKVRQVHLRGHKKK